MQKTEVRKFVQNCLTKYVFAVKIYTNKRVCVLSGEGVISLYENLSTALKSKGLSLNAAATILGMPEPTFRAKLSGRSQCGFSIDEAFTIKRNLFPEMDISYLFARDEPSISTNE